MAKPTTEPNLYIIWVVYDHPRDYPNCYVARKWRYDVNPPEPTHDMIISPSIEKLREMMIDAGLARIHRHPMDDRAIMEIWV